jgi:hypothetical protein
MSTLLTWKCGSHLYGPQKLEVHLHAIGLEHKTVKMSKTMS